jgi:hypothetical protein
MPVESAFDLEAISARLSAPVLIVSTVVGRGMYAMGEAFQERFRASNVEHIAIEDYLPSNAVEEDLRRYKFISNRMPFLLNLVYRVPVFYYRKYLREASSRAADLRALKERIEATNPGTVLCISHRPAFWVSSLKRRTRMDFKLWGVLGEFGDTLGWRYVFWDQMDGFLSPVGRQELSYPFPDSLCFSAIDLPARRAYYALAARPGLQKSVLLVCGYWGQGPIVRLLRTILEEDSALCVTVVCGENTKAFIAARKAFGTCANVRIHGVVDTLVPFLAECECVITKPGISTLVEAHAARRKLFLLKGMPVAEDNNARHALRHFGAEWFTKVSFRRWCRARAEPGEHSLRVVMSSQESLP